MDSRPIRIYSKTDVPRLRYIAGLLLGDILGLSWEVMTDKRKLGKYPVINYSSENIEGSFKISPHSLLFEKGVSPPELAINDWKGLPVFFPASPDSDIPFDIFAASFFLVTRYEEYLEFEPDKYGRFPASSSFSYKNGFLEVPIVDIWAKEMAKTLLKKFQMLAFKRNIFNALLAINVDLHANLAGSSLFRSIGGLFRDIKNHDDSAGGRHKPEDIREKDPYRISEYITENIDKTNTGVRLFFPVGDHTKFDKNPSWRNNEYRKTIRSVGEKYKTGLLSSFYASENSSLFRIEHERLNGIIGKEILYSRFHHLNFLIPKSYGVLGDSGIIEDYSMGYPEEPGFRAGIARPFFFFDVIEDHQTSVKIIPFQITDSALFKSKNLDSASAMKIISKMINETRKAGGIFVSIWNNSTFDDNADSPGCKEVFDFVLRAQLP